MSEGEQSLRNKATSGVAWSAFERVGQQGCAFVIQIVLARLLAPEQFGLIAMVIVFITISNALIDAGFGRAIIQRKHLTDLDVSSVFYFNCAISLLLAALLYSIAPIIAGFYEAEALTTIIRYLSLGLIFSGLGAVHQAKLSREMKFKRLFLVSFPATLVAGVLGIIMAFNGWGVWALVAQSLLMKMATTVLLWLNSGWRPLWAFDFICIKEMFPYGSRLAVSGVLDTAFSNLYVLVIGKVFTPVEVGLFQRARSFQQLPVQNIQSIVGRVAFPLFSSMQDDKLRMKRGMGKALQLISLFIFPGMALLAAIAESMILLLIGDKWQAAVPYLQSLCFVGLMYPLHAMNLNLLAAIGRSDLFLRLEVIKKCLVVANIAITYRFGVQVMIYGMILTSVIALILNTYYTKKFINYGIIEQLFDLGRLILLSFVIWAGAVLSVQYFAMSHLSSLLIAVLSGGVILYCGVRWFIPSIHGEISKVLERLPFGSRIVRIIF